MANLNLYFEPDVENQIYTLLTKMFVKYMNHRGACKINSFHIHKKVDNLAVSN